MGFYRRAKAFQPGVKELLDQAAGEVGPSGVQEGDGLPQGREVVGEVAPGFLDLEAPLPVELQKPVVGGAEELPVQGIARVGGGRGARSGC